MDRFKLQLIREDVLAGRPVPLELSYSFKSSDRFLYNSHIVTLISGYNSINKSDMYKNKLLKWLDCYEDKYYG